MLCAFVYARGHVGVNVRVVEETEEELGTQHARRRAVERRFRHASVSDLLGERAVALDVGQFHVNARVDGAARGVRFVRGDVVSAY